MHPVVEAGARLGPYTLVEPVGSGGVAVVWRAHGPEGIVAVKVLRELKADAEETRRLRREFLLLEQLEHPNIVKVYDQGFAHGLAWMAMELVEGADFGAVVEGWESRPPSDRFAEVERVLRALCSALAHLHARGVVHRDLKPQNVLIARDGRVVLTDFGALKLSEPTATAVTVAGRLVGTVAFMAPETITGEAVDARADLYSLGAVLYVALCGRRPIVADSIAGTLARHLSEAPRPPSEIDPAVPTRLERLCLRLLQKAPDQRPASADTVLRLLDAPSGAPLPMHGRDVPLAVATRRLAALGAGVAGVLVVHGPPGSGRSRFLEELADRADEAGLPVHRGATPPATGPTLWTIDDADELVTVDVAELVQRVLGETLVLVVLGVKNPAAVGGLGAEELRLDRLGLAEVRGLLRDHGIHGGAGAVLARRLCDGGEDLPAAVLEQLDALVDARWAHRESTGALRLDRPLDDVRTLPLPLPRRAVDAESGRLAAFPADQRAVLDALAVLDTPHAVPVVARVAFLPELTAADVLDDLRNLGLVDSTTDGLQELWQLADRRRRQVLLEVMAPERRRRLHRAAAETLATLYRRRVGALAEVVAAHMLAAGDTDNAAELYADAATRAVRAQDPVSATVLARRALRILPEPPASASQRLQRATIELALGDAERRAQHPTEAEDAYARALLAARTLGAGELTGRALAGLGLAVAAAGRLGEASGHLEAAGEVLPVSDPAAIETRVALGHLAFARGDVLVAERTWTEVCGTAGSVHDARDEVAAVEGLLLIQWVEGDRPVAALRALADRARASRQYDLATRLLRHVGELEAARGAWPVVLQVADGLDALGDQSGLAQADAAARALRASAFRGLGSPSAFTAAREALATARLNQLRVVGIWARTVEILGPEAGADLAPVFRGEAWALDPPWPVAATRAAILSRLLADTDPVAARTAALDAAHHVATGPYSDVSAVLLQPLLVPSGV